MRENGPEAPNCLYCGSASVRCISLFGSQLMTSQYRCLDCAAIFEHVRWEPGERTTPNPA